jgi:hypothetical protein
MDPQIWKNLPCDIVDKICNSLTEVRRVDGVLANEIKNQWYKFDRWYYDCVALFGSEQAYCVMYDDMRSIVNVEDNYPEEMDYESVVQNMWMSMTPEQRSEILIYY